MMDYCCPNTFDNASMGKTEGFQSMSYDIDSWLSQDPESASLPSDIDVMDEDMFETPLLPMASWIPEKERRLSFECFEFPSPLFGRLDAPVEGRDLFSLRGTSLSIDDPLSPSVAGSIHNLLQTETNSLDLSKADTEALLTNFDKIKPDFSSPHLGSCCLSDTVKKAQRKQVEKHVCSTPVVKFSKPPYQPVLSIIRETSQEKPLISPLRKEKRKTLNEDSFLGSAEKTKSVEVKKEILSKSPLVPAEKIICGPMVLPEIPPFSRNSKGAESKSPTKSSTIATRKIGAYSPKSRQLRIEKFLEKRKHRVWKKRVKYDCRKKLADDRPRIGGRFVKRPDSEVKKIDDSKPKRKYIKKKHKICKDIINRISSDTINAMGSNATEQQTQSSS